MVVGVVALMAPWQRWQSPRHARPRGPRLGPDRCGKHPRRGVAVQLPRVLPAPVPVGRSGPSPVDGAGGRSSGHGGLPAARVPAVPRGRACDVGDGGHPPGCPHRRGPVAHGGQAGRDAGHHAASARRVTPARRVHQPDVVPRGVRGRRRGDGGDGGAGLRRGRHRVVRRGTMRVVARSGFPDDGGTTASPRPSPAGWSRPTGRWSSTAPRRLAGRGLRPEPLPGR